jgi:hypothetical protein
MRIPFNGHLSREAQHVLDQLVLQAQRTSDRPWAAWGAGHEIIIFFFFFETSETKNSFGF